MKVIALAVCSIAIGFLPAGRDLRVRPAEAAQPPQAAYTCQTFTLPVDVEGEKATARYERGILSITLPKAEKAKAATIKVQKVT